MKWGFAHTGRFAKRYRQRSVITPSAQLPQFGLLNSAVLLGNRAGQPQIAPTRGNALARSHFA